MSLDKNEPWKLFDLFTNKNPINNDWVYKTKYNSNGDVNQFEENQLQGKISWCKTE